MPAHSGFFARCRVLVAACLACGAALGAPVSPQRDADWGQVALQFEANRGQVHKDVRFLARGGRHSIFLTAREAVMVLASSAPDAVPAVLRMTLAGGSPAPAVDGTGELAGRANYFIGDDPAQWRTGVPTYAGVEYRGVYPGIDLVYYGNQRQLEFDFIVAPRADPGVIEMAFSGADRLEIDSLGNLVLHLQGGRIHQQAPVIYQSVAGTRRHVEGHYVLRGAGRVGFELAAYDRDRPLVIDPVVLAYSTYLGGSGFDSGTAIAVGPDGSTYVAGTTSSLDFPATGGAFQTVHGGTGNLSGGTVFVSRLNPAGSALVYSTYLGNNSAATAIAVDAAGNAHVAGGTNSTTFPTTPGAFQRASSSSSLADTDSFVAKLDPTGSALLYSTYLGGSAEDRASGIAVDGSGNVHVTGTTNSVDFPVHAGSVQPVLAGGYDVFVSMLHPSGSHLVHSTFLGGIRADNALGIALDGSGGTYLTGFTTSPDFPVTPGAYQTSCVCTPGSGGPDGDMGAAFVAKLTASGLAYSTYLGDGYNLTGHAIAADAAGHATVAGWTSGRRFPTTPGAAQPNPGSYKEDGFVTRLDPAGAALVFSTFLGGSADDRATGVTLDAAGNAWVTGATFSADFPVTGDALRTSLGASSTFGTLFVTRLDATGSAFTYSTYLGGCLFEQEGRIAADASGSIYVTGRTQSPDFPVTAGALQTAHAGALDAFVVKLVPRGAARRAQLRPDVRARPLPRRPARD